MADWRNPGIVAALAAAALFGAATPAAKLLLGPVSPWLLAGLLYGGSGIGLFLLRRVRGAPRAKLQPGERAWLAAAIFIGGVLGPVLLLWGLVRLPASNASLLLNAEGVLTALIAWFVFRENFDRRIALGMALIVAGAVVLSVPQHLDRGSVLASLSVLLACFCWAIDNNLTRKVALTDASYIAMVKGLVAGAVNMTVAMLLGAKIPAWPIVASSGVIGFLGYGLSLVLFVLALRALGTARTAAYFSTAPFIGTLVAIPLLDEAVTMPLIAGGGLMAAGVLLHLTERHIHRHGHAPMEHEHAHVHDVHHQHAHPHAVDGSHVHWHRHEPLTHAHKHFPDTHHQHRH